jgi:thiamine biosynthesis lipoprotein
MTEPQPEEFGIAKDDWGSMAGVHRYSHEAMATTFEVFIQHPDAQYAQQAAWQAFDELDKLEAELSRYIENSDIARINNLPAGQSLQIGLAAFECLQISARVSAETNGAFDVTVGSLFNCWLNKDKTLRSPSPEELRLAQRRTGMHLMQLDEDAHTVTLSADSVQVDLGGIGKGYALDQMAELLKDWSIDNALIHGGFSSVLALDAPKGTKGWPLTISNPENRKEILARISPQGRAVSGSGLQKGQHIIDPRTARPVEGKLASWSCAPNGAVADALSTAFMVMSVAEIERYCLRHPGVSAMIMEKESEPKRHKILRFGDWPKST